MFQLCIKKKCCCAQLPVSINVDTQLAIISDWQVLHVHCEQSYTRQVTCNVAGKVVRYLADTLLAVHN